MVDDKSVMAVIRAARPSFRNNNDKIAFAAHSSFLASGYILTATGPSAFSETALSSPSTDEVGMDQWNELDDEYAFVYTNPDKGSKKVLVKCLAMDDKLLVDALADGASEPVHLEISVGDYAGENRGTNYSAQYKNLEGLVKKLDSEVLSKLDGSSQPSFSINASSLETSETRRSVINTGVSIGGRSSPETHPTGIIYPPINPSGGSDLFPGPGAGMYPTRGAFGAGGSMLVGPNDPRWYGGIAGDPSFPGGLSSIPPGARFDPYGPPGIPGFEPNLFARGPRRPPGSGPHPDLQPFGGDSDFI